MARIALAISFVAVVVTVLASASLGRSGPGPARAATPSGRQQFPFSTDRWVVVKYDGTVVYRSPGVVSATRTRKGDYVITFFRAGAELRMARDDPHLHGGRRRTVGGRDQGGDALCRDGAELHRRSEIDRVVTFNDAGANAGLADASFSVEAVC